MAHEQVSIGRGHKSAHGHAFDLEEILSVQAEVVGEDKLYDLDKELSGCGWLGPGRALI